MILLLLLLIIIIITIIINHHHHHHHHHHRLLYGCIEMCVVCAFFCKQFPMNCRTWFAAWPRSRSAIAQLEVNVSPRCNQCTRFEDRSWLFIGYSLVMHSWMLPGPIRYHWTCFVCQTGQVWKQVAEQLATESFARNNSPGTGSSHSLAQELLFLGGSFSGGAWFWLPGLFRRGKRQQHWIWSGRNRQVQTVPELPEYHRSLALINVSGELDG